MKVKAIIAIGTDGAIGNSNHPNGLPWESIREDFKHFQKESKLVKNIFMGRTTFEIILNLSGGKLLPERNIVIFSKTLTTPPHSEVKLCRSPYASFDILPKEDRMIAGGKSIYESCLPFIDEFIVSKIHGIFPADCYINESELLAKFVEDKEKSYVIREASDGKPLVTAHYYFRR